MKRIFIFVTEWKPIGYEKFVQYVKYMLVQFGIPFFELQSIADVESFVREYNVNLAIIIHSFDMIAEKGFPSIANVKYMGIFMEPIGNLEYYLDKWKHQLDNLCACIVPFLNHHEYFCTKLPNRPIFKLHQGYVPYEDLSDVNINDKPIDVLAVGFHREGVPDRMQVVSELRQRGLTVCDDRLFGLELDNASRRSKVSIYFPLFNTTTTFHGQRTLWAVNKQLCTIAIKSADTENETFYKDVYFAIEDANISKFCDIVHSIIQSNKWKELGQQQYLLYKTKFRGEYLFDPFLLRFLRDFTCDIFSTFDVSKYVIPFTRAIERADFPPIQLKSVSQYDLQKQFQRSITICNSLEHAFKYILQDNERDIVISSQQLENGSFNMSILELRQRLQSKTQAIFYHHHFNIVSNISRLELDLLHHEQKFQFRPIVVEIFPYVSHVISSKHICVYTCEDGAFIVWPKDKSGKLTFKKELFYNTIQQTRYNWFWEQLDKLIHCFTTPWRCCPIQMCRQPVTDMNEFPIRVTNHLQLLQKHLQQYNVSWKPIEDKGILVPIQDYVLDVLEEYLYISI